MIYILTIMFEPPEIIYKQALEKVETLRLESQLRRQFPELSWRHVWAQRLRNIANRLEPEVVFPRESGVFNLQK